MIAPFHPAGSILNETLAVDAACQKEAELSGLVGTFVALVSAPRRSLKELLQYQHRDSLPVVNSQVRMQITMIPALSYSR